jgi:hypothetical protein
MGLALYLQIGARTPILLAQVNPAVSPPSLTTKLTTTGMNSCGFGWTAVDDKSR